MDNYIFNVYQAPVYISDVNANENLTTRGEIFSSTTATITIGVGSSFLLELKNPTGSGKTLYLNKISITTAGISVGLKMLLYKNSTISSHTNTFDVLNNNFGSTIGSIATLYYDTDPTVTGGDLIYVSIIPLSIYSDFLASAITMPPNSTLVIKFSELVSVGDTSINLQWIEK